MAFTTDNFAYSLTDKSFITEMSTLSWGGRRQVFEEISPNQQGLKLVSVKTKTIADFICSHQIEDKVEGELLAWVLKPTASAVRKNPNLTGVTIKIFNT